MCAFSDIFKIGGHFLKCIQILLLDCPLLLSIIFVINTRFYSYTHFPTFLLENVQHFLYRYHSPRDGGGCLRTFVFYILAFFHLPILGPAFDAEAPLVWLAILRQKSVLLIYRESLEAECKSGARKQLL